MRPLLISLFLLSIAARTGIAADPRQWNEQTILLGHQYEAAARCLAFVTQAPAIAFNGEYEALISIIAEDPELKVDAQNHNGGAFYDRNPLYRLIDSVMWPMSFAAGAMHDGFVPFDVANRTCTWVAKRATFR